MKVGEQVLKEGGDYRFRGQVIAVFKKKNGIDTRVVVENEDGILHIFNPGQLKVIE